MQLKTASINRKTNKSHQRYKPIVKVNLSTPLCNARGDSIPCHQRAQKQVGILTFFEIDLKKFSRLDQSKITGGAGLKQNHDLIVAFLSALCASFVYPCLRNTLKSCLHCTTTGDSMLQGILCISFQWRFHFFCLFLVLIHLFFLSFWFL